MQNEVDCCQTHSIALASIQKGRQGGLKNRHAQCQRSWTARLGLLSGKQHDQCRHIIRKAAGGRTCLIKQQ